MNLKYFKTRISVSPPPLTMMMMKLILWWWWWGWWSWYHDDDNGEDEVDIMVMMMVMMMMSKNLNIGFPSSSLNHRIRLGRSLRRKVDFLDFVLDFLKIWLRWFVARQNELLCLFQSSKEYQRRYSGLVVWFYLSNSTKASTNREMAILSRLFLKMKYFAYFRFSCSVWGSPRCHQQ